MAHPQGRDHRGLPEMDEEPAQERRNWVPRGNEAPLSGEMRLAVDRVWRKGVGTITLGRVKLS